MLQLRQIPLRILNHNSRAPHLRRIQQHFVHLGKVRRLRHAMGFGIRIILNPIAEVDFVEADVGVLVLASSGFAEREQSTLRHGRQDVRGQVALRTGAYGPGA